MSNEVDVSRHREAVEFADDVYWIGALDPSLRTFDIILSTANGTSYNSYLVKGDDGVAIIDTVKENFSDEFFARLESEVDYKEIKAIILNHLEPDHTGALPELMRRAPQAKLYISQRATSMLKALLKPTSDDAFEYTTVTTDDRISLGDRTLRFLHTPFLHWPDTQCTYLEEEGILFSGDVFGCHYCDKRLFNDLVGDFRFSFDYYYAHIMRPFKNHVMDALKLIEPLKIKQIAPTHGPILRERPRRYVTHYRELSTSSLSREIGVDRQSLVIFYMSSYGNTARMAEEINEGAASIKGVRVSLYDLEGGEIGPFVDLIEEADA
ncbi:MAG: FprA family A-type flavoprotein, partial [Candidatus Thiodiazotropha sp. 6PLUC5]